MFNNPFSFSGRITRTEYALSYIIFIASVIVGLVLISLHNEGVLVFSFFIIALFWLLLAQGTKRCQDLGKSGFFQIIPFYRFWMIFEEGQSATNKYGANPKENLKLSEKEIVFSSKHHLPKNKTRIAIFNEMICIVLLNTLLIAFCIYFIDFSPLRALLICVSSIPAYFLLLQVSNQDKELVKRKFYLLRHRLLYVILLYVFVRLYQVMFLRFEFMMENIFSDGMILLFTWGVTYIPSIIYLNNLNKLENNG